MSERYAGPWVLSALVADRAERLGDAVAIAAPDGDLTFAGLAESAARIAGALAEIGVQPADRVATLLPTGAAYAQVWMGVVWAGAVDVPVNNDYRGTFLHHVLEESGARVIVTTPAWASRLSMLELPDLTHVVLVGEPEAVAATDVAGRCSLSLAQALGHDAVPRVERRPDDLLYIIYTSGTTGPSKGVMHSNESNCWYVQPFLHQLALGPDDVAYVMFPFFHQMGRTALTTAALWSGARSVLRPTFSVSGFWDDVRSVGATVFGYLGSVVHLLHEQPPRPDDADNPLRVGFGAAAPPEIVESFERRFDLTLLENYGSTELGVPSYSVPGNVRRGTMGTVNPCLEVAIHDDEDRPVAHGERGEIVVRPREPNCMMLGYWRQPEATLHALRNLWFHTGDLGTLTDDGFLTYVDRTKDVIRRRGENISSFEVERAVNAHPDVLECAAYALPSEITEDEVAVAVVAQPDGTVDLEALVRWCVETMPRFAVPRYVRVVPELPKTPSQRVEKYKLRAEGVTADTFDREVAGIVVPRSD